MTAIGPVLEVWRREEVDGVRDALAALAGQANVEHHDPALRRLVPDHLRVAILRREVFQHWILRILSPRSPAIVAVRQALDRRWAKGGVNENQRRRADRKSTRLNSSHR